MLWLAIILFILAMGLLWISNRQHQWAGLPGGRLIYSDTQHWKKVEKPLFSPNLGLTGKPDYLVEQNGQVIPVEVKTTSPTRGPYDAHIFQLAAYCMLVAQEYGKRPPHGILHYMSGGQRGLTYEIEFTKELEQAVLNLLQQMQTISFRKGPDRSHHQPSRCAKCGYRNTCDQVLVS